MFETVMCSKCGMLDISEDDEQNLRCGSSVGYFTGRSHKGMPVVREVDHIKRIYHGLEAVGCLCDPLLTISVYLD